MTETHLFSDPYAGQPVAHHGVKHELDFKYRFVLPAVVEPLGATMSCVEKQGASVLHARACGKVLFLRCGRMQQEKAIMAHAREEAGRCDGRDLVPLEGEQHIGRRQDTLRCTYLTGQV